LNSYNYKSQYKVVYGVDGVAPYEEGTGLVSFCITLLKDNYPILTFIYDPILRKKYWAMKGQGAYRKHWYDQDAIRIITPKVRPNKNSSVYIMFSKSTVLYKTLGLIIASDEFKWKNSRILSLTAPGIACGNIKASLCMCKGDWQTMAMHLLVTEAGGIATTPFGEPLGPYNTKKGAHLICAHPEDHALLLNMVKECDTCEV
jgi:fructose-1,6-bisphosphatase/inositol monophosphatase family enzyme